MKALIIPILILSFFVEWTPEEKQQAKSNIDDSQMSPDEKDVLYYINLVRINPKKYAPEFPIKVLFELFRIRKNNIGKTKAAK